VTTSKGNRTNDRWVNNLRIRTGAVIQCEKEQRLLHLEVEWQAGSTKRVKHIDIVEQQNDIKKQYLGKTSSGLYHMSVDTRPRGQAPTQQRGVG
jgi:hypothetical protein